MNRKKPPTWLSAEKYKPSKDIKYWSTNLINRLHLLMLLDDSKYDKKYILKKLEQCISSNISVIDDNAYESIKFLTYADINILLMDKPELANRNFIEDSKDLSRELCFVKEHNVIDASKITGDINIFSVISAGLSINLGCDDKTLIESFSLILKNIRKQFPQPKNKRVTKAQLSQWFTNSVLHYFDIKFWANINGIELTDLEIGMFLWPSGRFNVAEKVRKTTRKQAKDFFTYDMYLRMRMT